MILARLLFAHAGYGCLVVVVVVVVLANGHGQIGHSGLQTSGCEQVSVCQSNCSLSGSQPDGSSVSGGGGGLVGAMRINALKGVRPAGGIWPAAGLE